MDSHSIQGEYSGTWLIWTPRGHTKVSILTSVRIKQVNFREMHELFCVGTNETVHIKRVSIEQGSTVVILLVTSCWVSCDGLASHPGGVVILLVTLCWVSCDGLASHPGRRSNTPSHFMLGFL